MTVVVPGRTQVARTIAATGSLAARVDMPVGVAGEGGMVPRSLVQPGQWVRAGQALAVIDRAVQVAADPADGGAGAGRPRRRGAGPE